MAPSVPRAVARHPTENNMASSNDTVSMAVFCDFENVALGVRDAQYEKFDIKPVLERLLLKGSIVVKKAYCDWERYKGFKATMHEANFELIEIPHVRQSGKNSADIRLVVDALDLCYTKSHVNTFVIISGDSDFSPLVSKLRENAKQVIGVGVKQSTSDLLIANCDEFIFYDDLVRESQRAAAKRNRDSQQPPKRTPEEEKRRKEEMDKRRAQAVDMVAATFDALMADRSDTEKLWASVLKEALKRRNPGFNESYYGFRAFGSLLDEAKSRGLLEIGRDEKSGTYVCRPNGAVQVGQSAPRSEAAPAAEAHQSAASGEASAAAQPHSAPAELTQAQAKPAGDRRRGRNRGQDARGAKGTGSESAAASLAPAAPGSSAEAAPVPVAAPTDHATATAVPNPPAQAEANAADSTAPAATPRKPPRQGARAARTASRKQSAAPAVTETPAAPAPSMADNPASAGTADKAAKAAKTDKAEKSNKRAKPAKAEQRENGDKPSATSAEPATDTPSQGKPDPARKPASRSRRPRKAAEGGTGSTGGTGSNGPAA